MRLLQRPVTGWIVAVVVCLYAVWAPALKNARERTRQKNTLLDMEKVGKEIERGQEPSILKDHWGRPLRFWKTGSHYLIRSAGSDGNFDFIPTLVPPHTVSRDRFEDDMLFGDGAFLMYPEGVAIGAKGPNVDPREPCEGCHLAHPAIR